VQTAALCNAQQSNFIWFPYLCFGIVRRTRLRLGWVRFCNVYSLVWARHACAGNEESERTGGPKFHPGYFESKKASRSYTLTHVCWFSGLMASVAVSKRAVINVSRVVSPHVACHVACIVERYCVRASVRACVGRKGTFIIVGLRIVHLSIPQGTRCNPVSEFWDHVKCVRDCEDMREFTTNFLP